MMSGQAVGRGGADSKQDLHHRPDSTCRCKRLKGPADSRNGNTGRGSEQIEQGLYASAGSRYDEAGPRRPAEAGVFNEAVQNLS